MIFRLFVLLCLLWPARAHAYGWMIRHGYTSCAQCHADPSGAGPLTPYGRAQGELLLRTQYGAAKVEEAGPAAGFLFGALTTPEWLLAGGQLRAMPLAVQAGSAPTQTSLILMQADLEAAVHTQSGFRAGVSIGGLATGSMASLAGGLVSREHWAGWSFGDDAWLVRAGRINLPYGLRSIEHTLYVRTTTRTDLNDTQEHGVALAYSGELLRAEVMAVLGNYQVSPDSHRERGFSASAELALTTHFAVGASSSLLHAEDDTWGRDVFLPGGPNTHQAHGVFLRWSPLTPLVLSGEADVVLERPSLGPAQTLLASMAQADVEVLRGVHLIGTLENKKPDGGAPSYGGWLGVDWFFAPHADLRVDLMKRSELYGPQRVPVLATMAQGHVYF